MVRTIRHVRHHVRLIPPGRTLASQRWVVRAGTCENRNRTAHQTRQHGHPDGNSGGQHSAETIKRRMHHLNFIPIDSSIQFLRSEQVFVSHLGTAEPFTSHLLIFGKAGYRPGQKGSGTFKLLKCYIVTLISDGWRLYD
jgi:hypothetical protein